MLLKRFLMIKVTYADHTDVWCILRYLYRIISREIESWVIANNLLDSLTHELLLLYLVFYIQLIISKNYSFDYRYMFDKEIGTDFFILGRKESEHEYHRTKLHAKKL